jgi:chromate transport protein ChrA
MTTSDSQPEASAATPSPEPGWVTRLTRHDTRMRRLALAVFVYLACTLTIAAVAGPDRLVRHTAFNHFALLADAWLHGRQDLANGPPPYTQNNDFVAYEGKTFISFPPFPAMLMLPLVKLAGSPQDFRDGQFVIWLSGVAPAVLFLVLEKLRRTSRSSRSELANLALAFLFALGTVYFFTAVEGTVWFAAMVIAAGLQAIYLLAALDAERPALAGLAMACMYLTRPPMLLTFPVFAFEALRVSTSGGLPTAGTWRQRARELWASLDVGALARRYAIFAAPILAAFAFVAWTNFTRYGRPTPIFFDHQLLTVAWRGRMMKWGEFGYHFLGKNLGVMLTSLPWLPPRGEEASFGSPFKINEHGLALWFTTPLYLWILWPARFESADRKWLYVVFAISAALPATMELLYQNTGWRQFGYRFSNDYALLLFVLLAIGGRPMRGLFTAAAAWSLAWNLFGAATFDKLAFDRFYFRDGSQTIVYQPD